MFALTALFTLSGLLLISLAIPLIQEKIKPNWFYGFRVPKTINNPHIWYPVNKYGGWWLLGMGALTALTALILAVIPGMDVLIYVSVISLIIGVYTLVMSVALFRYLNRIS